MKRLLRKKNVLCAWKKYCLWLTKSIKSNLRDAYVCLNLS